MSIVLDGTLGITSVTGSASLCVAGPAFSAYLSANQTPITTSTFTKLQANTKEFDTASCYDNVTNYRFTPNVAGYYQVNGSINGSAGGSSSSEYLVVIYKNGSAAKWGNYATRAATVFDSSSVVSALIYMNGTTDYIELYGYITGSGTLNFVGSQSRTFFQAFLARSA
jgi:hypothetical protein